MATSPLPLAVAAPARCEAPYLLEWIAYHRALGVRGFILGDNGGADGTSELIVRLQERGLVVRLDFLGARYFQWRFNALALEVGRLFCTGLFFVDVDEFLRPMGGHRSVLEPAEAWLADPAIGAVALNWAVYGTSGRDQPGEGLVIERFTRRAERDFPVNRHSKPFVRVEDCAGPSDNPHAVELRRGRYVDSAGQDVVWTTDTVGKGVTAEVKWAGLRIDHFVLKSRQEFELKKRRGSVAGIRTERGREREDYRSAHDRNEVEDPMPDWIVERTRHELDRLHIVLARDPPSRRAPL